MRRRAVVAAWAGLCGFVLIAPLVVSWALVRTPGKSLAAELATTTGLVALSVLVVALVMPARLRSLVSSLGIEKTLRSHRLLAVATLALVAAHIVLVLITDPRGIRILDLRDTTAAAWAGIASALGLAAAVGLAVRRRKRRPRYEGWRLLHIGLAAVVVVTAGLHVWWLDNLTAHPLILAWLLLLAAVMLMVAARRWVWLPWRAHRRSYLVEEVFHEPGDAVTLVVRAHGHEGLPFRAGQFAWLKNGSSSFVFEEHPFTIASTADQPDRKSSRSRRSATSVSSFAGCARGAGSFSMARTASSRSTVWRSRKGLC